MTDHGWLDHHDDDPGFHDEPVHFDDHQDHDVDQTPPPEEHDYFDVVHHDQEDVHAPEGDVPYEHHVEIT